VHNHKEYSGKTATLVGYVMPVLLFTGNGKVKLTTVLIIDDDVDMTDVLKLILNGAGFEVITTNSSLAGLELARQPGLDTIILDLLMPDMDGWQVCKAIREFSCVPIIILSVFNKPGMLEQALDAGADDYLVKPVPSGVLVAHINGLTRRARVELEATTATNCR
jgi:DNA-binding response OmpR family regulator